MTTTTTTTPWNWAEFDFGSFPQQIPVYPPRTHTDGQPLQRMKAFEEFYHRQSENTIKEHNVESPFFKFSSVPKDDVTPLPYEEFVDLFQCSPNQPDLDQGMALAKFIKPTRDIVEMLAAQTESMCETWEECREKVNEYKEGKYDPVNFFGPRNSFTSYKLLRVTNNSLYVDWPWGVKRLSDSMHAQVMIQETLQYVGDFKDSVFFGGGEVSTFPWNYPFVFFANAPLITSNEVPYIWPETTQRGQIYYYEAHQREMTYTQLIAEQQQHWPWHKRDYRVAFYASLDEHRLLVLELERQYPDLIYSQGLCKALFHFEWNSFNPSDSNGTADFHHYKHDLEALDAVPLDKGFPVGSKAGLLQFCHNKHKLEQQQVKEQHKGHDGELYNYPVQFKYVLVPLGAGAGSNSGRLADLMSTSGAVILLQTGPMAYHFSKRLVPWVHFVPVNYNLADVAEKVAWLQDNDELAEQLAKNARTFADNYLRLEDHFCYYAKALHDMGEFMAGCDALKPFDPVLMKVESKFTIY